MNEEQTRDQAMDDYVNNLGVEVGHPEPCSFTLKATQSEIIEHFVTMHPNCDGFGEPRGFLVQFQAIIEINVTARNQFEAKRLAGQKVRDMEDDDQFGTVLDSSQPEQVIEVEA